MLLDGVGERVEHVVERARRPNAEQCCDEIRVLEEPVHRKAEDVPGDEAEPAAERLACARLGRRLAVPDLVPAQLAAAERRPRLRQLDEARRRRPNGFACNENGCNCKQSETVRASVDARCILDSPAEHLQAAADPEHPPSIGGDGRVEAGASQPREVGGDVLRSRQDDEIGAVEIGRVRGPAHVRDLLEQLELVEVRRERVADDGDDRPRTGARRRRGAVLVGKPVLEPRQHAERRHARQALEHRRRRREQRRVAAELVQHESADELAFVLRQQRPRSVQVRERAASVDVRDEHDRGAGCLRTAHVREVGVAQVDLRRTSRALEKHELVLGEQVGERRFDHRPERGVAGAPRPATQLEVGAAEHDDLAAVVAFRLHEHRVHPHVGLDARGERLQVLRDPDLAAGDDARVVRHVLRLERDDVDPASHVRTCERRRQQALPRRARRALHHQRAHASSRRRGNTKTWPFSRTIRTDAP